MIESFGCIFETLMRSNGTGFTEILEGMCLFYQRLQYEFAKYIIYLV